MRLHQLVTFHDTAILHARANRTDPFAYKRAMHYLEQKLVSPRDMRVDAERIIKNAPANPVMIAAAKKAGLI